MGKQKKTFHPLIVFYSEDQNCSKKKKFGGKKKENLQAAPP